MSSHTITLSKSVCLTLWPFRVTALLPRLFSYTSLLGTVDTLKAVPPTWEISIHMRGERSGCFNVMGFWLGWLSQRSIYMLSRVHLCIQNLHDLYTKSVLCLKLDGNITLYLQYLVEKSDITEIKFGFKCLKVCPSSFQQFFFIYISLVRHPRKNSFLRQ